MALLTMIGMIGSSSSSSVARTSFPTTIGNGNSVLTRMNTTTKTIRIVAAKAAGNNKKTSGTSKPGGKFDSKNRRASTTTLKQEEDDEQLGSMVPVISDEFNGIGTINNMSSSEVSADGTPMPVQFGLEKDFWEGPEWDGFGFVVQYLWAFGVVFALVACGCAVATYNEGATDFKKTPAYQESIQSRDSLEDSEDVFESNPTEEAPSLE